MFDEPMSDKRNMLAKEMEASQFSSLIRSSLLTLLTTIGRCLIEPKCTNQVSQFSSLTSMEDTCIYPGTYSFTSPNIKQGRSLAAVLIDRRLRWKPSRTP